MDGDSPTLLRVEVDLDAPRAEITALRAAGLDDVRFHRKSSTASMIVGLGGLDLLRELGYEPRILEDVTQTDESMEALSDYHDEEESAAAIEQIALDHPDIVREIEYAYASEEGRTIHGVLISDNPDLDEAEPRIFFVSQHHAREVMTPELLIDLANELTDDYGVDPEITEWVDAYQIYIVPCHNPDGTHHVFNVYSNWRKNRRDNGDGSYGVDPNRNYPYAWGPDGCGGSSGTPSSDTYRGPSAGSEPETQGIVDWYRAIDPSISLTYHTYGELVLHPMGCSPAMPDDPDLRAHRDIGSMLAAVIDNDNGNGWYELGTPYETIYDVDGGSDDWMHAVAGAVAFTIEMNSSSQGFQPDYDTWRDDTVARNLPGPKYLLRRLGGPAITGRVRDACSEAPLEAEIGVAEQLFTQDQEPRTSLPDHGFYHRVLEPGEYTWYGESAGYHRQEWPISLAFEPVVRDLWLVPEGSEGVEHRGFRIDDAAGDGDGQADPGEIVLLLPTALASGESVSELTATLSTEDPYLVIRDAEAAWPDLAAGDEAEAVDGFEIEVLADAPDGYVASLEIAYAAFEPLCRDATLADLRVSRGVPSCPFEIEPLDEDPLWDISGPSGGWEFGVPGGSGGTGGPDAPHSGDYVYGTNLDGNYGSSEGEFVLTSTPFDLEGLRDAELRFWRYLNSEPAYDLAWVDVSVDGEDWTEVWRGFGRDTRWEQYRIELPEFVDDESQVRLRFRLRQDGGGSRSGFFIDDISFCGESALTAGGKLKYEDHTIVEDDPNYGNADGELDAGETATMRVTLRSTRSAESSGISAVLSTTAPGVEIHNAVADYPDIPAGASAESLAPHFSFTTGPDCAARIPFTLEVRDDAGVSSTSHFDVRVGTLGPGVLFEDDMEEDLGWTVSNTGDPGAWERSEPYPSYYQSETTNPDEDHTPHPGIYAYNTQSVPPPVVAPPFDAEVDTTTVLTSPPLAAGAYETLELSFWRWFYTGGGGGPDTLRVEVSSPVGGYRTVHEIGTKANAWTEVREQIDEFVQPHDGMVLRFIATDGGGESIVEAGIDDLDLSGERWVCDEFDLPVLDPPNPVGDTLMVSRDRWDVRLSWEAPPTDPSHGPATFYDVSRSETAAGGFDQIGRPTAPRYVDLGAAGPSAPASHFYLVAASNEATP